MSKRQRKNELVLNPNCGFCGKRFQAGGNLLKHERSCGSGIPDRYRILAITGHAINPGTGEGSSHDPPGTTYTVHDTAETWQEVGWYGTAGRSSEYARRSAEILCRKLNRRERDAVAA